MAAGPASDLVERGRQAFTRGDYPEACNCFEDALRIDESDEECQNLLAMTLVKLGNFEPAIWKMKILVN